VTTLPLTVTEVEYAGAELYRVTVALADGTLAHYLIPATLATVEAVRISAIAMGVLLDPTRPYFGSHHRGHRRYDPRN